MSVDSPIEYARRINRTWFVRGGLAEDTQHYLAMLERERPEVLARVCDRAVKAAYAASEEGLDPKPGFYGSIFSEASEDEKEEFLKNHPWTRARSRSLAG